MNDGIIFLSDETYYNGAAVIQGKPEYVKVIVENSFDVPFWQDLLKDALPDKDFDISPFSYKEVGLNMGKSHIYKMAANGNLGPHFVGCVDADYDYLLGNHTNEGLTLVGSKYLIHTFAYSVENLLCCPNGFAQVCTQASKHQVRFPFEEWMRSISIAVYPLLTWSLFLDSRDDEHQLFSVKDWSKVFPHDKYFVADKNEIVKNVAETVSQIVAGIESKVSVEDQYAKNRLEKEMAELRGLTPVNCYMYVRGHDLYSFVRDTMVKPAAYNAKQKHLEEIDAKTADKKERGYIRSQYVKQVKDVEMYLEVNYAYKAGIPSVYNRIKELCIKSQS